MKIYEHVKLVFNLVSNTWQPNFTHCKRMNSGRKLFMMYNIHSYDFVQSLSKRTLFNN